jgi:hypothetical protein
LVEVLKAQLSLFQQGDKTLAGIAIEPFKRQFGAPARDLHTVDANQKKKCLPFTMLFETGGSLAGANETLGLQNKVFTLFLPRRSYLKGGDLGDWPKLIVRSSSMGDKARFWTATRENGMAPAKESNNKDKFEFDAYIEYVRQIPRLVVNCQWRLCSSARMIMN